MNSKQRKTLIKVAFGLVVAGLIYIAVFFNWTVTPETAEFIVSQNSFAVQFVENFQTNYVFYLLIAGTALVGYLFATSKKRR